MTVTVVSVKHINMNLYLPCVLSEDMHELHRSKVPTICRGKKNGHGCTRTNLGLLPFARIA